MNRLIVRLERPVAGPLRALPLTFFGDVYGIRTRVPGMRTQNPKPLDENVTKNFGSPFEGASLVSVTPANLPLHKRAFPLPRRWRSGCLAILMEEEIHNPESSASRKVCQEENGGPGETRTHTLVLRRHARDPFSLLAHGAGCGNCTRVTLFRRQVPRLLDQSRLVHGAGIEPAFTS